MFHLWFHLWFCITGSLGSLSALCPVWGVQDSLACAQKWRGGAGGQKTGRKGGGNSTGSGKRGGGKRDSQGSGNGEKNYATLSNISQAKKCKEAGANKYWAGIGIKGYGKRKL